MTYREIHLDNFQEIVPLYMHYYNTWENGQWTADTARKRIHQVVSREDAFGLIAMEDGVPVGFAVGNCVQYGDGVTYDLNEIVIAKEFQGQGRGTQLIRELAARAKEKGAFLMQLESVNDGMHAHFYHKCGFYDANNLIPRAMLL